MPVPLLGAPPTLGNYQYQYKNNGVTLNTDALPFWDVESVTGLDFPEINPDIADLDGAHGGFIHAAYTSHRVIVIEGTLYAASDGVDSADIAMRATMIPSISSFPFYFKHPGIDRRFLLAKPLGYRSDIDTGRRLNKMPFQIQLGCEDPRIYISNTVQSPPSGDTRAISNDGIIESFPYVSFTGTLTDVTFENLTYGESITFSGIGANSGDTTVLNHENRTLVRDGLDITTTKSGGKWWTLRPGTQNVRVTTAPTSTTTNIYTWSAWL